MICICISASSCHQSEIVFKLHITTKQNKKPITVEIRDRLFQILTGLLHENIPLICLADIMEVEHFTTIMRL